MLNELKKKILQKKAKIGIIGLGYVGLPLAVTFAKSGFKVHGIDIDRNRVEKIQKGESYILDVPKSDLMLVKKDKSLAVTTDFSVIKELDAVIICVPTPLYKTREPDVSYIVSAVKNIKRYMKRGQIIVLESTTYPGTTEEVMLPILEEDGFKEGKDFYLAFSPERVDPGNKKYDTRNTPKIIGGISKNSTEIAKVLYEQALETIVPVSSSKVAEMVKLLENTFRIVNIGLVNEILLMCDKLKIDAWEVIDAAKTKPYGFMPFYPGPGVGGHCLGQDEQVFVKDKDKGELRVLKISDFVKESKNNPKSRTHNLRGTTFIRPNAKEVFSYDVVKHSPCFREIGILSERPYEGDMVNIKMADSRILSVTSKHPMLVYKEDILGVKFADEIEVGDEIPFFKNIPTTNEVDYHNCKLSKIIVKGISYSRAEKVYSMEVRDTNTFVTSYGVLTHNCIPVDPIYLSWKARMHGFEARFIDLASQVNSEMPHHVISKITEGLNDHTKSLKGSKVLVVGVAYKKDVKDLRESPALEIINTLIKKGADISYYDPLFPYLKIDEINLNCAKFSKDVFRAADCVVIVTDHTAVDYGFIVENSKLIIDTRNVLKNTKDRANIIKL